MNWQDSSWHLAHFKLLYGTVSSQILLTQTAISASVTSYNGRGEGWKKKKQEKRFLDREMEKKNFFAFFMLFKQSFFR